MKKSNKTQTNSFPGIFSKKRAELSAEELEWIRKYDNDKYHKTKKSRKDMSPEELVAVRRKDKKQKTLDEMTPKERELKRARNKRQNEKLPPKTPEQKAAKREYDIERRKNMTPEQKQKLKESQQRSKEKSKSRPDIRYKYLKTSAKHYNIEVGLTLEEYTKLISLPCFYCNNKLCSPSFGRGLDRIDNSRGYFIDNVLPCGPICNQTRSDKFTVEETLIMIQAMLILRATKNK